MEFNKRKDLETTSDIAIIGMGAIFPESENLTDYWQVIKSGRDCISEIPAGHWSAKDYFAADPKAEDMTYGKSGGFLKPYPFNPMQFGIPPHVIEATDTSQLFGMIVAHQAMVDAGYGPEKDFDRSRVSCVLGVTGALELVVPLGARLGHPVWRKAMERAGVDTDVIEDVIADIKGSYVGWQENSFPGLLGNVVAGRIANRMNLGGTNCVVDAACASSLGAVHLAMMELQQGKVDMVLTGGIDTFNDIFMYMCFSKTPALSPTGHARPFAANADGTTLGEGAGVVILKRLKDAEGDGDTIYGVMKSMGSSSDGKGHAVYAPSRQGQVKALKRAYSAASIDPSTVSMVEGHGTGTKVGDQIELSALIECYREAKPEGSWCVLGSVKSQIGHTKAAAGAAGLIKTVMALHHKVLPPSIKAESPQESVFTSPFYLSKEIYPWLSSPNHKRRAALSAFGFGGSNFHCVLEEYHQEKLEVDWNQDIHLVTLSAESKQELMRQVDKLSTVIHDYWQLRCFAARSRIEFCGQDPWRLCFVLDQMDTEKSAALAVALKALEQHDGSAFMGSPLGFYLGHGSTDDKMALLFSGQGSQFLGMGRESACVFPQMLESFELGNEWWQKLTGQRDHRLSDLVIPTGIYDEGASLRSSRRLRDTSVAQPALAVVSAGYWKVLSWLGIKPDVFAGHSFGELTACFASGAIDEPSLMRLAIGRGQAMGSTADGEDRGKMLAVQGSREDISSILDDLGDEVVLANANSPQQMVLAGTKEGIDQAQEIFSAMGYGTKELNVSAAFHSFLMVGAVAPFSEALAQEKWKSPQGVLYSGVTAKPHERDSVALRRYMSEQLVQSINYEEQICNMYDAGVRCFIEVGPGRTLTQLNQQILRGKNGVITLGANLSGANGSESFDLARLVAALAVNGRELDLEKWHPLRSKETSLHPPLTGHEVMITGAHSFKPKERLPPSRKPSLKKADPLPQSIPSIPLNGQRSSMSESKFNHESPSIKHQSSEETSARAMMIQQNLLALQNLQKQQSEIHLKFLEQQSKAQEQFAKLMTQQMQYLERGDYLSQDEQVRAPLVPSQKSIDQMSSANVANIASRSVDVPEVLAPSKNRTTSAKVPSGAVREEPVQPDLESSILRVIGEKTGYPSEMLSVDMSMEADLGIDSIKRVEIFSALAEILPVFESLSPEQAHQMSTLGDLVAWATLNGKGSTSLPSSSDFVADKNFQSENKKSMMNDSSLLLKIIADKTGYPASMLEETMDLESDLGIDSIKRVEIFSAISEAIPAFAALNPEELHSLRTISDIEKLFRPKHSGATVRTEREIKGTTQSSLGDVAHEVKALVAHKTGYPADMLDESMGLEADLGIDSIKRVEIFSALQDTFAEFKDLAPEMLSQLMTLGDIIKAVGDVGVEVEKKKQKLPLPQPTAKASSPAQPYELDLCRMVVLAQGIDDLPTGIWTDVVAGSSFCLVGDGAKEDLKTLASRIEESNGSVKILTYSEASSREFDSDLAGVLLSEASGNGDLDVVMTQFQFLRRLRSARKQGRLPALKWLAGITHNGGRFGLDASSVTIKPESAGLSGLIKTLGHEDEDLKILVCDLAPTIPGDDRWVDRLMAWWILGQEKEVGIDGTRSFLINLRQQSFDLSAEPSTVSRFDRGDVVIVTGGARGVTAEVASELGKYYGVKLAIFGRSLKPEPLPQWYLLSMNESYIKAEILRQSTSALSPRQLQEEFVRLMARKEMLDQFEQFDQAGISYMYVPVDVCDAGQVQAGIQQIIQTWGRVDGVVHGAGVLADKLIEDKTDEQFAKVYQTKVLGLKHVLDGIGEIEKLKAIVLFSSTSGRFGRKGQCDYAAANEVLNKWAQLLNRQLENTAVMAVNWGPWDGGMVSTSLKEVFHKEGLGLIPLQSGAKYLSRELNLDKKSRHNAEMVVFRDSSSKDVLVEPTSEHQLLWRQKVSVDELPILRSHVLKGHGVLPMVLGAEWMLQGARQRAPHLVISGLRDLKVIKGLVLSDQKAEVEVRIEAAKLLKNISGLYELPMYIRGEEKGQVFFQCVAQLGSQLSKAENRKIARKETAYEYSREDIYRDLLFHGRDLEGIKQVLGCDEKGLSVELKCAPSPRLWQKSTLWDQWILDPLVADALLQSLVLWSRQNHGAPCLPVGIEKWEIFAEELGDSVVAHLEIISVKHQKLTASIEIFSHDGVLLSRADGVAMMIEPSLQQAYSQRRFREEDAQLGVDRVWQ